MKANFSKFISLSFEDVGGVCRDVGAIFEFTAKTSGRDLKKRDVTLVDRSSASVCISIVAFENWNE